MTQREHQLRNKLHKAKIQRKKLDNIIEDITIELTRVTYHKWITNKAKEKPKFEVVFDD